VRHDPWSFLSAILHEWRVLLTGGSVVAIIMAYALATGRAPIQPVGWTALSLTLLGAIYQAWRRERLAKDAAVAELHAIAARHAERVPRIRILDQPRSPGNANQLPARLEIVNPDERPVSFMDDWRLIVRLSDGRELVSERGGFDFRWPLDVVAPGERVTKSIYFTFPRDPFASRYDTVTGQMSGSAEDAQMLAGATFTMSVTDVRGNVVRASWPNKSAGGTD